MLLKIILFLCIFVGVYRFAPAILIIKIGFLKGSRRLPFKKPILGVAAPTALQHSKLVSK